MIEEIFYYAPSVHRYGFPVKSQYGNMIGELMTNRNDSPLVYEYQNLLEAMNTFCYPAQNNINDALNSNPEEIPEVLKQWAKEGYEGPLHEYKNFEKGYASEDLYELAWSVSQDRNLGTVYRGQSWKEVFEQVEANDDWRDDEDRKAIATLADVEIEEEF